MCMIDGCDDAPTVYRSKHVKARKNHACGECSRPIKTGEIYRYTFMVFEGTGDSYHICQHCDVACTWLIRECGGFVHEAVWEDISEHIDAYPGIAIPLMRLKIGSSRGWERFDKLGLLPLPKMPPSLHPDHGTTDNAKAVP